MTLLIGFEKDLAIRRRSDRTIQTYKSIVDEFLIFHPDPSNVTSDDLEEYLVHLLRRDLRASTLKGIFSALSSFYEYLIYKKLATSNPITGFRKRYLDTSEESDRRQILEVDKVAALVYNIKPIRERTIVMVLAKTGIRRSELLLLKPEDVDLNRDLIFIERKKRAKNRVRFIDRELHIILEQYLAWRESRAAAGKCKTQYLWISDHGGRVHKDYINQFIQQYAYPLGLHNPTGPLETRLSCHCFRGFLVTHLRRAGMKKEHIQTLIGHTLRNEVWSAHYLGIDMRIVQEEYLRCVPQLL